MSEVAVVARDLIVASRIEAAATAGGHRVVRVDDPAQLPPASQVAVAFVDWGAREPGWAEALRTWRASRHPSPRLVLFGPHTDVLAHREARSAGIGPMLARSKLFASLAETLASD